MSPKALRMLDTISSVVLIINTISSQISCLKAISALGALFPVSATIFLYYWSKAFFKLASVSEEFVSLSIRELAFL